MRKFISKKSRPHGSSFVWRAITSVAVLLAFLGTLLGIIGGLFAVPLVCLFLAVTNEKSSSGGMGWAVLFVSCWGCSLLLARGLVQMRCAR